MNNITQHASHYYCQNVSWPTTPSHKPSTGSTPTLNKSTSTKQYTVNSSARNFIKHLLCMIIGLLIVNSLSAQSAGAHISKADQYYKNSNYLEASFEAIKALKINPKKKKAQELLSFSYEMAIENLQEETEELKSESITFKDDNTVRQRAEIVANYKNIKKLGRQAGEISRIVKSSKYNLDFERIDVNEPLAEANEELAEAKEEAAEMHLQSGLKLKKEGGLDNNKLAAKAFKKALHHVPNYKECQSLYEEARRDGTTRIAIFEFENKSGITQFGAIGELISDKLTSELLNNKDAMEFVELVSRDELAVLVNEHNLNMSADLDGQSITEHGKLLGVHKVIVGKVTQISSENQPKIDQNPYKVSKRVKVSTENYVNSSGKVKTRPVYGEVYAMVFEHKKTSVATISGAYKVLDVKTGKIIYSNQIQETYTWTNKWRTYKGDDRAIKTVKNNGYSQGEETPPTNQQMANNLLAVLSGKMSRSVINKIK